MEEIIFSLKHYWRFVDSEALELKALSQGGPRKPHEHRANSAIGEVRITCFQGSARSVFAHRGTFFGKVVVHIYHGTV